MVVQEGFGASAIGAESYAVTYDRTNKDGSIDRITRIWDKIEWPSLVSRQMGRRLFWTRMNRVAEATQFIQEAEKIIYFLGLAPTSGKYAIISATRIRQPVVTAADLQMQQQTTNAQIQELTQKVDKLTIELKAFRSEKAQQDAIIASKQAEIDGLKAQLAQNTKLLEENNALLKKVLA